MFNYVEYNFINYSAIFNKIKNFIFVVQLIKYLNKTYGAKIIFSFSII